MLTNIRKLVGTILLSACGEVAQDASTLTITIDSAGGYPIVRSIGDAPVWRTELVATITAPDSQTGEFGEVRSVLLAGDGTLYVVDPRYRAISKFDSTGAYRGRVGRVGPGPGEYANPYSLAWLGDSMALFDPGNSRIELFTQSERWLGTWTAQRLTGSQNVRLYRTPPTFWAFASGVVAGQRSSVFVHYTRAGPGDTLAYVPRPDGLVGSTRCNIPGGIRFFGAPFAPDFLVIPTPTGERAVAITSEYRIAFLGKAGDTVRVIERTAEPPPISDVEWKAATADWDTFRQKTPAAPCDRDGFARPSAKPPLAFMFYDHDGRLWVELTAPAGTLFDVFDAAGRLLATVEGLPPTGGIDPSVRNGRVAVVRDSLDVRTVALYRLQTAAR